MLVWVNCFELIAAKVTSLQYGCKSVYSVCWKRLTTASTHTNNRDYRCFTCFVVKVTGVTWQSFFVFLLLAPIPVYRQGRRSGVSGRQRVFNIRRVVFISRLCESGVGLWLVQVDVGDVQTDVVFSLQAWQDGWDVWHQCSKAGPQFWIRVPALEHNAIPGKNSQSKRFLIYSLLMHHYYNL